MHNVSNANTRGKQNGQQIGPNRLKTKWAANRPKQAENKMGSKSAQTG